MSDYRPTTSALSIDSESESFHIKWLFDSEEEEENSDNLYETPRVVSPSRQIIQGVISIDGIIPPHAHYVIDTDDDDIENDTDEPSQSGPVDYRNTAETPEQAPMMEGMEGGYAAPNKSPELLDEDLNLDWLFNDPPAEEIPEEDIDTDFENLSNDPLSEDDDIKSEDMAMVFVSDLDEPHSMSPFKSNVQQQIEKKSSPDSKDGDEYGLIDLFKRDSTDEEDSIEDSRALVSIKITKYPSDHEENWDDDIDSEKPQCSTEGDHLVQPSTDNDAKPHSDTEEIGFLYTPYDLDPEECGHFAIPLHHSDEQAELAQELSETDEAQEDEDEEEEESEEPQSRGASEDDPTISTKKNEAE